MTLASLQEVLRNCSDETDPPLRLSDLESLYEIGVLPVFSKQGLAVRPEDVKRLGARVMSHNPANGLFMDLGRLFDNDNEVSGDGRGDQMATSTVFLQLSPLVALSFSREDAKPDLLQLLISGLRTMELCESCSSNSALPFVTYELGSGITLWSKRSINEQALKILWDKCISAKAVTHDVDILTLPKLYGNKQKLTEFIAGVARSYVGDGSPILDLMCGSGIVSRKLTEYYQVHANDANLYAAILTEAQFKFLEDHAVYEALSVIESSYQTNVRALTSLLNAELNSEQKYLHTDLTEQTIIEYREFCDDIPLQHKELRMMAALRDQEYKALPYCLTTAYFSNAYFGLRQSIQIDGVRLGIEQLSDPQVKLVFLAALLVAGLTCASGPHFAQPPKMSGQAAAREIIEHRARDFYAEFLITARMMIARNKECRKLESITVGDWREGLRSFLAATSVSSMRPAVYIDPPYTKLQFSRYYHVLNTLVSYNYPGASGQGRYPPREQRFSSKFEYQPGPAQREFHDLFRATAAGGLRTLLSYSDRGFVPVERLAAMMEESFGQVDVYSKALRHHSQGKRFEDGRQNVTEYILVGLPKGL